MVVQQRSRPLLKNQFAAAFAKQKTTTYTESATRSSTLRTLAWNPLGTLIATGERTLRIWNPEKNHVKNSTELKSHGGVVERVAWHPLREAELASCGPDGIVRFWDVRSKSSIGEVKIGGEGFTLAWKPNDGSELLVGTKDDTLIRISTSTHTILSTHRQPVQTNQTTFSYPGTELLLTTGDGTVKILEYPSMVSLHTIAAHTSSCYAIDLAPTGRYLAVGGSDALLTLWDTRDFVCQRSLDRMTGSVKSVGFSFDGNYVIGGADEGSGLDIAHVETGEYVYGVETGGPASVVQWHPSRYVLAYGDLGGLKIVGAVGGL